MQRPAPVLLSALSASVLSIAVQGQQAASTPYGTGCYEEAASFYELFSASAFDLGGTPGSETVINFFFTGAGYVGFPGAATWRTPQNALTLSDDSVQTVQLPFALPYPGGSTSIVGICSNGYLWLDSNTSADYTPTTSALLRQSPRFAPAWTDLNPSAGGTVYYDTDPTSGAVFVTYDAVFEYGGSTTSTFQVVLFPSGNIDLLYRDLTVVSHNTLVGWSPGGNAIDPGGIDISATTPIFTGLDRRALTISSTRPIEGSLLTVNVSNIPAGTTLGVLLLSGTQFLGGTSSPISGMSGCLLYVGVDDPWYFYPTGATHSVRFPNTIPAGVFTGQNIYMQAAALAPGVNTAGVASSNGLDLRVGVN